MTIKRRRQRIKSNTRAHIVIRHILITQARQVGVHLVHSPVDRTCQKAARFPHAGKGEEAIRRAFEKRKRLDRCIHRDDVRMRDGVLQGSVGAVDIDGLTGWDLDILNEF